jgi:hypothetical protein
MTEIKAHNTHQSKHQFSPFTFYLSPIYLFTFFFLILLMTACRPKNDVIPTIANPEAVATGFVLTENAPPTGFDTVSFPRIDANLDEIAGWRYEMEFEFIGRFARTPREANASTTATVWYKQLDSSRRVIARIQQDLQGEDEPLQYEGVRLGPDAFLVRDGTCQTNAGEDAALVADLSAGDLLGGVNTATTAAQKQVINGQQVWRYDFDLDAIRLPNNIAFGADSRILSLVSELWIAPEYNVVVRYYVTMEVENIIAFESPLPVSGTLIMRYDLYDIGVVPSINIPFGC